MSHKAQSIDAFYTQIMNKVMEKVRSRFDEEAVAEENINLLRSVIYFYLFILLEMGTKINSSWSI